MQTHKKEKRGSGLVPDWFHIIIRHNIHIHIICWFFLFLTKKTDYFLAALLFPDADRKIGRSFRERAFEMRGLLLLVAAVVAGAGVVAGTL